jgi:hypothetical protein
MPQPEWSGLRLYFLSCRDACVKRLLPTNLAHVLTAIRRIDNFVLGKEFVGEDRNLDRILRRLKLHAEGRQFGGQNSRAWRAHQIANADSLEWRRFRDSRQWQTASFQTRHRRLAGLRRHRQGDQKSKVAHSLVFSQTAACRKRANLGRYDFSTPNAQFR